MPPRRRRRPGRWAGGGTVGGGRTPPRGLAHTLTFHLSPPLSTSRLDRIAFWTDPFALTSELTYTPSFFIFLFLQRPYDAF